jgi:hypothetical protein
MANIAKGLIRAMANIDKGYKAVQGRFRAMAKHAK